MEFQSEKNQLRVSVSATPRAATATAPPHRRWNRTKPASSPHANQARSGDRETGVWGSNHRTHRTGAYRAASEPSILKDDATSALGANKGRGDETEAPRASVRGRGDAHGVDARASFFL
jgi:hypothetical protein